MSLPTNFWRLRVRDRCLPADRQRWAEAQPICLVLSTERRRRGRNRKGGVLVAVKFIKPRFQRIVIDALACCDLLSRLRDDSRLLPNALFAFR